MERFTLPEALKDTNDKLGDNVQSLVRPLTDPSVRAAWRIRSGQLLFPPCACIRRSAVHGFLGAELQSRNLGF